MMCSWQSIGSISTRALALAVFAGLMTPAAVRAGDEPAILDLPAGSLDLVTVPLDIPGENLGPRTRAPETPKIDKPEAIKPEEREWIGGKPFLEWSRLTGDWGGVRTELENAGLTLTASYTLDWAGVWSGGVTRRASTRHMIDVNLDADLEKLAGIKGGRVFAWFQSVDSRDQILFVGSAQSTTTAETGRNIHQLSELWWEQNWFDGLIRTKVGKIDNATEFGTIRAADLFTHSGGSAARTLLFQPTYPDPSLGAVVFVYPCKNFYAGAGLFDGSLSAGVLTGGQGPKSAFEGSENYWISEVGLTWDGTECEMLKPFGSGRIAGGFWYLSGELTRFDGTPSSNAEGGFVLFEQQIFRRDAKAETDERGLFIFVHGGLVTPSVSAIDYSIAGGLTLRGTFEGRDDDAAGCMFSHAHLSNATGSTVSGSETAYEVFYQVQVTPALTVRPYLQYIYEPSGNAPTGNATIGGLRVQVSF
ncbi:MAG: carbohydrate porin [Phycisphaerales bacterium]|nr:carbohydrate porin [Phycisphaerales bacterium]